MYKWCATHGRLVMFLSIVPVSIVWIANYLLELPILFAVLYTLFMFLSAWGFVNSCASKLIIRTAKSLNEFCDPYPLLIETDEQLYYSRSKTYRQLLLINYCCALSNTGEYKKVQEQLETINIDKYAGMLPYNKAVYYNNLACIYLCNNQLEKAEIWHNKSIQLTNDLNNKKQKKMLEKTIQLTSAEIAYYKQDYEKAIEILNNVNVLNMRDKVSESLLYAKIFVAQNKIDEAKLKLIYVIENGNKLIDVQIAKGMLAKF